MKAFDCVNHDILLSKLACYGVLEHSLVWFTDIVKPQVVGVYREYLLCGARYILACYRGPGCFNFLFSIYINDLHNAVKICESVKFMALCQSSDP